MQIVKIHIFLNTLLVKKIIRFFLDQRCMPKFPSKLIMKDEKVARIPNWVVGPYGVFLIVLTKNVTVLFLVFYLRQKILFHATHR